MQESQARRWSDRVGVGQFVVGIVVLLVAIVTAFVTLKGDVSSQAEKIKDLQTFRDNTQAAQQANLVAITRLDGHVETLQSDVLEIKTDVKSLLTRHDDKMASSGGHAISDLIVDSALLTTAQAPRPSFLIGTPSTK